MNKKEYIHKILELSMTLYEMIDTYDNDELFRKMTEANDKYNDFISDMAVKELKEFTLGNEDKHLQDHLDWLERMGK